MLEILGSIATVLAITGVVFNNRRLIWCFPIWMVSNAISAYLHADAGLVSLLVRDCVFMVLAVDGWWRWGKAHKAGSANPAPSPCQGETGCS